MKATAEFVSVRKNVYGAYCIAYLINGEYRAYSFQGYTTKEALNLAAAYAIRDARVDAQFINQPA